MGKKVTKFKEGDAAGVGFFVETCMKCEYVRNYLILGGYFY